MKSSASHKPGARLAPSLRDVVLFILCALAVFLWPLVMGQPRFLLHVGIIVAIYVALAMSMNLMLRVGQLSLAHGALFGIGAYGSAILSRDFGWPFYAAFLGAGAITAAVMLIVGPILLRVKGVHFALLTFAFGEVVVLCFVEFHEIFGGNSGFGGIPAIPTGGLLPAGRYGVYLLASAFALIVFVVLSAMYRRELGPISEALDHNERLATASGLEVLPFRVAIAALSGGIAGFAGSFFAHHQSYISPDSFSFWTAVNLIIMNVLGGRHLLLGAVIGALFLVPLPEFMRDFMQYERLIYGVTLILLLLFLPKGLLGHLHGAIATLRARGAGTGKGVGQ